MPARKLWCVNSSPAEQIPGTVGCRQQTDADVGLSTTARQFPTLTTSGRYIFFQSAGTIMILEVSTDCPRGETARAHDATKEDQ
jgi:hypothetical protein